mmetsp:Transcript_21312/g.46550  ORF Transcript_21312/g.46550 Transcript_21312/m.46550 type:complete len:86 (+) Transcript_21312:2108-2365(+)
MNEWMYHQTSVAASIDLISGVAEQCRQLEGWLHRGETLDGFSSFSSGSTVDGDHGIGTMLSCFLHSCLQSYLYLWTTRMDGIIDK